MVIIDKAEYKDIMFSDVPPSTKPSRANSGLLQVCHKGCIRHQKV
jgi:hypothetical protein